MAAIDSLLERLNLERLDDSLFRGYTPDDGRPRIFGGLVAAQAVVAACRTVEDRAAHSLHGYFLRMGDPKIPVIYDVDRIRDGRSFATRRVVAIQHGKAIFNMSVSFHAEEEGLEYQEPMPDTPDPETIPSSKERLEEYFEASKHPVFKFLRNVERPVDQRDVDHVNVLHPEPHQGVKRLWVKADGPMPDDPVLHQGVLAYSSDLGLLDNSINRHGRSYMSPDLMLASLDHAIWYHRPFRADEWLLFVMQSPSTGAGRGMNFGYVYSQGGTLVASIAQEGLMRNRRDKADR